MDERTRSRDVLASARQLIAGSREMVAWSIARIIATDPPPIPGTLKHTALACGAAEVLLQLLDSPCDLDVLIFAQRHPRALLTVEDIARAVGRDAEAVRASIETLMVSGLIAWIKTRRPDCEPGVLFYEFTPGTWDAVLPALCWVTSSPDGRRVLRQALCRRRTPRGTVAGGLQ
jgi:hypothetical protein